MTDHTETRPRMDVSLDEVLAFYRGQSPMSEPGTYEPRFAEAPEDVPGLVKTVQGLMIHIFWAERYGLALDEARQSEVQLRTVRRKMARLLEMDSRPLNEPRALDKRLVGNCRDFSLMSAALLRSKGIPARARCGFGTYFLPNHFEDHWVVEYWNDSEKRWVMFDAQMDEFQQGVLKLPFNPLDMPAGHFITGGEAWRMCRAGKANPDDFGIFEYHGWDFIKGNVFRDLLSLNKFEVLPWDFWKPLEWEAASAAPEQLAWVDKVSEVTVGGNECFGEVRALYTQHPDVPAPLEWAE